MAEPQKNPQSPQKPRVEEKPPVVETSVAVQAPEKSAAELVQYLIETGAPFPKTGKSIDFLVNNPKASAKEYLDLLAKEGVKEGTVRRAGKWVFGASWEPETAAQMQPLEEVKLLRQQVATLEAHLAEAKAHLAASRRLVKAFDSEKEHERSQKLINGGYGVRDNPTTPQQHGITHKPA